MNEQNKKNSQKYVNYLKMQLLLLINVYYDYKFGRILKF